MQEASRSWLVIEFVSLFLFSCFFIIIFLGGGFKLTVQGFIFGKSPQAQHPGNLASVLAYLAVSADSVDFTDYSWSTAQESHGCDEWGAWGSEFVGISGEDEKIRPSGTYNKTPRFKSSQSISSRILMKLT